MTKIDLKDVAILIPVRIDSLDRLENLIYVTEFILKYCDTNIYILQADKVQRKYLQALLPKECNYNFIEDIDPIFHRTRYINELFNQSDTSIISIWDADVVISPNQLYHAANMLRNEMCEVCFPYDGRFYNVDPLLKDLFYEFSYDIDFLTRHISKMHVLYKEVQNGGAIFISRKAFINSGCEDESFYGWGPEDWNRVEKWNVLKYRIQRTKGPLFHLSHSRDINGIYRSYYQRSNCQKILKKTMMSSPEMLSENRISWKNDLKSDAESLYDIVCE